VTVSSAVGEQVTVQVDGHGVVVTRGVADEVYVSV